MSAPTPRNRRRVKQTGALVVLWLLGRLTVTTEVAKQLVYGDGHRNWPAVGARGGPNPWWRMAIVPAVLAILHVSVVTLADLAERRTFESGANRGLER